MIATIRSREPSLNIIRGILIKPYCRNGSGLKRKPKEAGLRRKGTLEGLIRYSTSKGITPSIK
jgi:hypothetical protein